MYVYNNVICMYVTYTSQFEKATLRVLYAFKS